MLKKKHNNSITVSKFNFNIGYPTVGESYPTASGNSGQNYPNPTGPYLSGYPTGPGSYDGVESAGGTGKIGELSSRFFQIIKFQQLIKCFCKLLGDPGPDGPWPTGYPGPDGPWPGDPNYRFTSISSSRNEIESSVINTSRFNASYAPVNSNSLINPGLQPQTILKPKKQYNYIEKPISVNPTVHLEEESLSQLSGTIQTNLYNEQSNYHAYDVNSLVSDRPGQADVLKTTVNTEINGPDIPPLSFATQDTNHGETNRIDIYAVPIKLARLIRFSFFS